MWKGLWNRKDCLSGRILSFPCLSSGTQKAAIPGEEGARPSAASKQSLSLDSPSPGPEHISMATWGFASPPPPGAHRPEAVRAGGCWETARERRFCVGRGQRSGCGSRARGLRELGGRVWETLAWGLQTAWQESAKKPGGNLPRLLPEAWGTGRGLRARHLWDGQGKTKSQIGLSAPSKSPPSLVSFATPDFPSPIGRFCSISRPWHLAENSGILLGRRWEWAGLARGLLGLVVQLAAGGSAAARLLLWPGGIRSEESRRRECREKGLTSLGWGRGSKRHSAGVPGEVTWDRALRPKTVGTADLRSPQLLTSHRQSAVWERKRKRNVFSVECLSRRKVGSWNRNRSVGQSYVFIRPPHSRVFN